MTRPATSPTSPEEDRNRVLVLAGGQSRRMGTDKTEAGIDGETLLARALSCALGTGQPVVVAGRGRIAAELPDSVETCLDGPGEGPLAGLLGAAARWPGAPWLLMACDLPLLTPALLLRLGDLAREHPRAAAVVPVLSGRMHPLCAWYGITMVDRLLRSALAGNYGLTQSLTARPDVLVEPSAADPILRADAEILGWCTDELRDELLNCNRPSDLHRAREILHRRKRGR